MWLLKSKSRFDRLRHKYRAEYFSEESFELLDSLSCKHYQTSTSTFLHTPFPQYHPHIAIMADAQLYEESFNTIGVVDSTYDRVWRISGTSSDNTTSITLDINSELYPISNGETFSLLLASTLNLDGTKDEGHSWRKNQGNEGSLADMWDYVCYGKVYKVEDPEDGDRM